MIRLSDMVLWLFLFFMLSTGIFLVLANIGVSNTKLDTESVQDLENLNIYYNHNSNPFSDSNSLNYSLTAYSNTDEFAQSNLESKGALESILNIFGDNKLTAMASPLIFVGTMLPIPSMSFDWLNGMTLAFIGIIVFIAFLAAWKGGLF